MNWKENVFFTLVEPKESGNIGSSARAMKNMGFTNLALINPPILKDEARWMAWRSEDILDKAEKFYRLDEALKDKSLIVGTTRRRGSKRGAIVDVKEGVKRIYEVAQANKVAILFGREDKGLFNEEIEQCGFLITIPTSELQPSLNLSQAVLIIAYELMRVEEKRDFHMERQFYVNKEELDKLYDRLLVILKKTGYIPENEDIEKSILNNFKHLFGRTGLTFWELKMLHGLLSHIEEIHKSNLISKASSSGIR